MEIGFGAGVQAKGTVKVLSPMMAQMEVEVAEDASSGQRHAAVRPGLQQPWQTTSAVIWVVPLTQPYSGQTTAPQMPAPKLAPFKLALQTFKKGVITLDSPVVRKESDNSIKIVPVLRDDAVFKWKEQNPGTADFFELRILDLNGNVLIRKRIEGALVSWPGGSAPTKLPPPTYYQPEPAFLDTLLHVKQQGQISVSQAGTKVKTGMSVQTQAYTGGSIGQVASQVSWPPNTDLLWEVAGFRNYQSNGIVKTAQADQKLMLAAAAQVKQGVSDVGVKAVLPKAEIEEVEVEISERWPLRRPGSINGFGACPLEKNIEVLNMDSGKGETGKAGVNHPFERWIISGSVDLSQSPYLSSPAEYQDPNANSGSQAGSSGTGGQPYFNTGLASNVLEHQFDNLFVDWGDGTVVPLHLAASGSAYNQDFDTMSIPDAQSYQQDSGKAGAPDFYTHQYQDTGPFTIRVYQLAERDVQQVNPGDLADAYDGSGNSNNGYFTLRVRAGGGSGAAREIAGRAYQLYCHTVNIEPIMDPVANGPLQLQSVEITGFGAKEKITLQTKAAASVQGKGTAVNLAKSGLKVQPAKGVAQIAVSSLAGGVDATCSACNKAFTARALLKYLGTGNIEAVWKVKTKSKQGVQSFPDSGAGHVAASPSRSGDPANWGDPSPGSFELTSPFLPVDPADVYEVTVEAWVKPDPPLQLNGNALREAVRGRGGKTSRAALDSALSGSGRGKPQKIGFLRPYAEGAKAAPPVLYLDSKLLPVQSGTVGGMTRATSLTDAVRLGGLKLGPPFFVQSATKKYKVVASDATKPCEFYFAGEGGDRFPVYLDQDKLQQSGGGIYRGSGTMGARLTTGSAATDLPAPVSFQNWKVDDQGNVASGTKLELSPGLTVTPRGLTGSLSRLIGVAGQKMDAMLDVKVADSFLRKAGTTEAPAWNVTGRLRESGDWNQDKPLSLGGETALGWSGFYIESDQVTLDLNHSQGQAPQGPCQDAGGNDWTGVNFGSASIKLNTADLVTVKVPTTSWGVTDWICGKLAVVNNPQLQNLTVGGKGKVSFNSVSLNTSGKGNFSADYDMDVQVPFLDVELHGKATLQANAQEGKEGEFEFAGLKPDADIERDYGPIHLHVPKDSFRFGQDPAGYRVIANPEISFKAESKPFIAAPVAVPDMRFGMNGRTYFDSGGAPSRSIPLGGVGQLGKTSIDLSSVKFTGGASGDDRLTAAFNGELHLSQALPAAEVQANYRISGDDYAGSGPTTGPFKVQVAFPAGQPSIDAAISPTYAPSPNPGTRYLGSVDLAMFGGPPVKAEFLLGFQGNTDYWLTRAAIPLGSSGVPLYPPYLYLYQIRGGLGYHMALDSFKNPASLESAQPDTSQSVLFMAGMRAGSADQFTYTVDGDLTVSPSSGARMDFHAWLLKTQQTGTGDFSGYFQYAGGNFDGRLWGHLGFLNDAIYFDMGNGESNAAVAMHFGGGWYIYAGKNTGPRIKAHMLVSDADSYLMLSDAGLMTGGAQNIYLGVGSSSVASAYVKGYMDIGLQITPQPRVAGDFGAGAEAGVCVAGACESMGVTAAVHAEALPVNVRAHATVEFPWPLPDVSFDVHL